MKSKRRAVSSAVAHLVLVRPESTTRKDQTMTTTTTNQTHAAHLRELCPLLFVQDIRRSIAFYRDTLGFRVSRQADAHGSVFWCRLEGDACSLMLQQAEPEDG